MKTLLLPVILALLAISDAGADEHGMHLFILSGQSHRAGLSPDLPFTLTDHEAFGQDGAVVVKDAQGERA